MILKQDQIDWLNKLNNKAAGQKNLDKQAALKATLFAKAFGDTEDNAQQIFAGSSLTMIDDSGDTQATLNYGRLDATEVFDHAEQKDGFKIGKEVEGNPIQRLLNMKKIVTEEWDENTGRQEQFEKHLKTAALVDDMVSQLQEVEVDDLDDEGQVRTVDDGTGKQVPKKKKLFDDKDPKSADEIAAAVYDPLVRRGLIAETSVPDKYSRTHDMVEGSFEAYQERLKSEDQKSWWGENGSLTLQLIKSTVTLAGTGHEVAIKSDVKADTQYEWKDSEGLNLIKEHLGLEAMNPDAVALGEEAEFASASEVAHTVYEFCETALEIAIDDVYENIDEFVVEEGEEKAKGKAEARKEGATRIKQAPQLAAGVSASIAVPFGTSLASTGLAVIASSVFGAAVKPASIAKEIRAHQVTAANIDKIAAILGDGIEKAMSNIDPNQGGSTAEIKTAVSGARAAIKANITDQSAELVKFLNKGNVEQLLAAAAKAGAGISDAIGKQPKLIAALKDNAGAAQQKATQELSKTYFAEDEVPAKEKADHDAKVGGEHHADWVKVNEVWVCTRCEVKKNDASLLAGILEEKIKALKKQQKIIKLLSGLGAMAFDVAAAFIAPLAIGGSLISLAKNGYEAISRANDFLMFTEDHAAMLRAASAYSAPVSQFMDNAYFQGLYYTVLAATDGLKIIGAIVQCTPAAPAGVGISSGATATAAITQVLNEIKKRVDLEIAWKTYKTALENKENRKLGLIAMKKNPTLAKYAVAWGACVKEDPLVGDFMHSCGLNAATLRDPKKNIDMVVTYLETRMPDDNIVVGGEKRRGIGAS